MIKSYPRQERPSISKKLVIILMLIFERFDVEIGKGQGKRDLNEDGENKRNVVRGEGHSL